MHWLNESKPILATSYVLVDSHYDDDDNDSVVGHVSQEFGTPNAQVCASLLRLQ
jgi:hypothetical protein